ncbi:MAG: nuclear transport factor 2 family protein [Acidobacteria bacterium]|nr:nuclear transport factor 2 family protein [Acidobacteriota bacterium]
MTTKQEDVLLISPVRDFVDAVNAGSEEGFLSFFDETTGVINDWGRIFTGHVEIKKWSDKEFIGAKGTITPQRVETNNGEISLWAGWKSNYYSGDSKFVFVVDGDSIKEMRIESAK